MTWWLFFGTTERWSNCCGIRVAGAVSDLPFIDKHAVEVAATPEGTWQALLRHWERSLPSWFARLLGCQDSRPSGPRPLAQGSAVVGFHVEDCEPPRRLVLAGSHRFARYQLIFHVEAVGEGRSRLSAETRAEFPGLLGRIYRLLVIGCGPHILATRWILGGIRRRAEKLTQIVR